MSALAPLPAVPLSCRKLALKRLLDVTASGLGLLALLPIFAMIALAIKLDGPGPVFFHQQRVGRGQTPFVLVKFRTMRTGTPDLPTDEMIKLPSPITRVGALLRRTSLDELPQLWNVLKGEMSLVGPRPALYSQEALNEAREAAGIHALPPGITGWAQINGRDELEVSEKVAADRWYLERAGAGTDLMIIARTFVSLFSKRGVY